LSQGETPGLCYGSGSYNEVIGKRGLKMTVAELIEVLKTKDQNLIVEVNDECGSGQELKKEFIYSYTTKFTKENRLVLDA
jgi:hypothetical protein